MDIRKKLWALLRTQDQITHLNEIGQRLGMIDLKNERRNRFEEIAKSYEALEDTNGKGAKEVFEL